MQWGPTTIIQGIRISAALKKEPSNVETSFFQRQMQWCLLALIPGIRIYAVFEKELSNFETSFL